MKRRRLLTFVSAAFLSALCGWSAGKFARLLVTESESPSAVPSVSAAPPVSAFDRLRHSPAAAGRALAEKGEMDNNFAKEWAAKDPRSLYAWLLKGRPQPSKEVIAVFFKEWALRDPDAAFEAARNLPPRFKREKMFSQMLHPLLKQDMEAALKWAERVQGEINGLAWPNTDWIKEPPEVIAKRLSALKPGIFSSVVAGRLASHWAETDLPAARAWVETLDPAMRQSAFYGMLQTWAAQDMEGALKYLQTEVPSQARQAVASRVLGILGETEPLKALSWMEENLASADSRVISDIFSSWARKEGGVEAARDWIEAVENPQLRVNAITALAENLSMDLLPEFVEWMKGLPAREERAAALERMAYSWAHGDAEGFRAYLSGLPGEEVTSGLLSSASYWLSGENAVENLKWAAGLTNGAAERAVSAIVARWRENAPQEAAVAVDALPPGPAREAGLKALRPAADPFLR